MLGLVPGGAHPDLEPAIRNVIDRDCLGGQDRWRPVGDPGDERAQPDPGGSGGESRQQRPALHAGPVPVTVQRREVIEHPGPVEARLLREDHSVDQFRPEQLMLGDVQANPHPDLP